ncbi:hypothetical protein T552_01281 [Pneumocystis carinii B80]|uniref:60S acidic ribosomal protein P2 n=1 Tax=Pneumocystis carinii (strain B80) TaxID=1408658 RepID=A0A0W4ZLR3_PNEC8|nr:hypothetical protein T552_01281 [Pneumocystis carinii B80]KTW29326.1 hypothetical protein T552_01281 [Pneumocystis carinii B80]
MKHLAAYLLLELGGNKQPNAEDIRKVLGSVGLEAEEKRLNLLLSKLENESIEELIASGKEKLAFVSSAALGSGTKAVQETAVKEEEPVKEEEKEESDEDMGFGLFD